MRPDSLEGNPMTRFSTAHESLGPHPLVTLVDAENGNRVRIARRGATVVGIEIIVDGTVRNIADGYRDAQELAELKSSRFAIMAPFANRIGDARYRFDGEDFDMQPGVVADRAIRHGFLRSETYEVTAERSDAEACAVTLTNRSIRPGVHAGYPFAIDVSVTYTLDAGGLTLDVSMRNVGERAAPCFFGWHPYFRLGDTPVDSWVLEIPADTLIATDAALLPLSGTAAWQSLDTAPVEFDFRAPRAIGAQKIDNGYADLRLDVDGRSRTRLRDPASGLSIAVWQEHGVMLAFSGDTVPREPRTSVALEPMECMSNAFNRDDCAPLVRLEPGEERRFTCGVEVNA
jgi:aldose 1-epimerase